MSFGFGGERQLELERLFPLLLVVSRELVDKPGAEAVPMPVELFSEQILALSWW